MAEGNGNGNGNGVALKTPLGEVRATGLLAIILIATASVIAVMLWQTDHQDRQHDDILHQTIELKTSIDDLFLSNLLTPDQKQELPPYIKEKARQKTRQKAVEITDQR